MGEGNAAEVHNEAGKFLASEILKRQKEGEQVVIPDRKKKVAPTAAEASTAAEQFLADLKMERQARASVARQKSLKKAVEYPVSDSMIDAVEPAEAPPHDDEDGESVAA